MKEISDKKLFLVTTLSQGGLETYLLRFLKQTCRSNENVVVFCRGGVSGSLVGEFRALGVRVMGCSMGYLDICAYRRFLRILRRERFDVVCDFSGNFSALTLLCARLVGVKIRIAQYRGAEDHFKPTLLRRIYNLAMKWITRFCATRIVSNSAAAFDYFFPGSWRNNPKFKVIYNGVNIPALLSARGDKDALRAEFGIPMGAFVVGHTGRYNRAKNHDTIISVAIELCKKYADVYFFLAGIGVPETYAERVAREGLSGRILMPGYRKDVPRLLAMMDVFYFPSLTEGQPNSLIEAEIAGLPIVASDIAPIREAVPENFHSKLIPPQNVRTAVDLIERLRESRAFRKQYVCDNWARKNFDGTVRFEEFRKVLKCS